MAAVQLEPWLRALITKKPPFQQHDTNTYIISRCFIIDTVETALPSHLNWHYRKKRFISLWSPGFLGKSYLKSPPLTLTSSAQCSWNDHSLLKDGDENTNPIYQFVQITWEILMFMCRYITCIIINDDQQDAAIFYLFISSLLYMFQAIPSPIIRST
jgi:hypothetical protein